MSRNRINLVLLSILAGIGFVGIACAVKLQHGVRVRHQPSLCEWATGLRDQSGHGNDAICVDEPKKPSN